MKIINYNKNTEEGKQWINDNYEFVYDFLCKAYESVGGLKSFDKAKAIKRNALLVRVVYTDNEDTVLAIAVYSGRFNGFKCTALAKTFEYPKAGKTAVIYLLTDEIIHFDNYFWCEASHGVAYMLDKLGAAKIPNMYVSEILKDVNIQCVKDDEYLYNRIINQRTPNECVITKTMYGFNDLKTLNRFKHDMFDKYEEFIKRREMLKNISSDDPILESLNAQDYSDWSYLSDLELLDFYAHSLNIFINMFEDDNLHEVSQFIYTKFKEYLFKSKKYFKEQYSNLSNDEKFHYKNLIEIAEEDFNEMSIFTIHLFEFN